MICNKKLTTLIAAVLSFASFAANDMSDLRGLAINDAKIPVYGNRQQLQMMTFVDNAVRDGKIIAGKNTVLDLIRSGANVDDIKDAWKLKYYPLKATLAEVFKFWAPRISYSEGVVITEQANIDQEQERAFGESPIYFRSPLIDLDGIGFDVSFKRRTIQVNSDVKVVLRTAASDPRKLKSGDVSKAKYSFVRAYSDTLLIDIERNQIMLIGSVRVIDRESILSCDRLTIFLEEQKSGKERQKSPSGIAIEGDKGVSRILADGNVVITNGVGLSAQRAMADHLNYDIRLGIFHFTGDKKNPQFIQKQEIVSGKTIVLYREEQQARVIGECSIVSRAQNGSIRHITSDRGDIDFKINRGAFAGNVVMRDAGVVVSGPRANLELAGKNVKAKKKSSGDNVDQMLPGGMGAASGFSGGRELQAVEFPEGIRVVDRASQKAGKPMDLTAKNGRYDAIGKFIDFKNNVVLNDSQMTLNADTMQIKLDEKSSLDPASGKGSVERIVCQNGVKIVGKGDNAGTLTAQIGVFFYRKDILVFVNDVKLVNKETTLDCDRLDLYLSESKQGKKAPAQTGIVGVGGSSKILSKAVASGRRVVMVDPQTRLDTKKLTLLFEEVPAGSKKAPGMLQSGNSRVTWIACDGGIKIENRNKSKKAEPKRERSVSKGNRVATARRSETDLKKNVSVFYENVSVFDDSSRVDCDKMTIFAEPLAGNIAKNKENDPDADPFALAQSEDSVPSNIMLGKDMELKRVLCEENVILSSSDNNKQVKAGGDQGEYLSVTRKMIVTSRPPERSWITAEGRKMWCDRIIYDLDDERIYAEGRTYTEPYRGN